MAAMCVCGRYIYSTSANPWNIYTLDGQGRVIEGTCVHGVHFSLQENNIMNIRGGYNGKYNDNISGLVGNIGGIISDSSSQV